MRLPKILVLTPRSSYSAQSGCALRARIRGHSDDVRAVCTTRAAGSWLALSGAGPSGRLRHPYVLLRATRALLETVAASERGRAATLYSLGYIARTLQRQRVGFTAGGRGPERPTDTGGSLADDGTGRLWDMEAAMVESAEDASARMGDSCAAGMRTSRIQGGGSRPLSPYFLL